MIPPDSSLERAEKVLRVQASRYALDDSLFTMRKRWEYKQIMRQLRQVADFLHQVTMLRKMERRKANR